MALCFARVVILPVARCCLRVWGSVGKALQKLQKFIMKLGYPDKWKDYSALVFADGDGLFQMEQKVQAFEHKVRVVRGETRAVVQR